MLITIDKEIRNLKIDSKNKSMRIICLCAVMQDLLQIKPLTILNPKTTCLYVIEVTADLQKGIPIIIIVKRQMILRSNY